MVVGSETDLYQDTLYADPVSWVSGVSPTGPVEVTVKIRYKFAEAAAIVTAVGDGALVRFREPQRAITPGQAAVFYQGDTVLGGGAIAGQRTGGVCRTGGCRVGRCLTCPWKRNSAPRAIA